MISAYNVQREIGVPPVKKCTGSNEGEISYNSAYVYQAKTLWICKSQEWIPYKYIIIA